MFSIKPIDSSQTKKARGGKQWIVEYNEILGYPTSRHLWEGCSINLNIGSIERAPSKAFVYDVWA